MATPKSGAKLARNRNSSTKKSQKKKRTNKQTPKKLLPLSPSDRVVIQSSSTKSTIVTIANTEHRNLLDTEAISTNDLTIEENDSDIEIIEENVTVINLIEESEDILAKESSKITSIPSTSSAKLDLVNEISVDENNGTISNNESNENLIVEINETVQSNTNLCDKDVETISNNANLLTTPTSKDPKNNVDVPATTTPITTPTNQPLFFSDTIGGGNNSLKVPLYDTISDTSFLFDDSTITSTPNNNTVIAKSIRRPPVPTTPTTLKKVLHSPNKSKSKHLDDSVVFVSETVLSSRNDFIPIANKKRGREVVKSVTLNKKKKPNRNAQKQNQNQNIKRNQPTQSAPPPIAYVCNLYNPNKVTEHTNPKRMIIIDGNNVAFGHSCNNEFSVRGIVICIEFFEREGHIVKAVLPQMRLKQRMSSDSALLETLQKQGKILLTPCKNLPGQRSISYDDRFIMDLAVEFDAAVISNDNYKDLLDIPKYRDVILARVVGYTWCNDMIMLPQDPYGRNGPSLSEILNRNVN